MVEKKIGRYISIRMGITMSVVMSVVGSTIGALKGTNSALSNIPVEQAPSFMAIFMSNLLPSLCVSLLITVIIAIAIGFIIPMKKINDNIESKMNKDGFVLHLVQSIVSDLIYTPFISLVMSFVSTVLFVIPKSPAPLPFVPVFLGSFISSVFIEFVIALVVIMIVEPIFRNAAFTKYIPNYGHKTSGDDGIA